jgi:hypothetical protein
MKEKSYFYLLLFAPLGLCVEYFLEDNSLYYGDLDFHVKHDIILAAGGIPIHVSHIL